MKALNSLLGNLVWAEIYVALPKQFRKADNRPYCPSKYCGVKCKQRRMSGSGHQISHCPFFLARKLLKDFTKKVRWYQIELSHSQKKTKKNSMLGRMLIQGVLYFVRG